MKRIIPTAIFVLLSLLLSIGTSIAQQAKPAGRLGGTVKDERTAEPIIGATIIVEGTRAGTITDVDGRYMIKGITPGKYTITVRYAGYKAVSKPATIADNAVALLDFMLATLETSVNEIVVTASKGKPEKKLESPITIETVNAEAIRTTASPSPLGAAAKLKGIDFVERGINTVDITSRGLNTQFNTRMLTLVDGKLATFPGIGLPQFAFSPSPAIDLAGIEIVVGPAAALYGPNAHAGVVNMITKDPFNFPGAEISAKGGSQSLYDIAGRYADYTGKFGWKVTGQYMHADNFNSGNTFIFYPKKGLIGENQTLLNPETLASRRITNEFFNALLDSGYAWRDTDLSDFKAEFIKADGAFYYRPGTAFNMNVAAGYSQSTGFVGSNFGVLEANGYKINYQNVQFNGRIGEVEWYVQVSRTGNSAGNSFQLHDKAQYMAQEVSRIRRISGNENLPLSELRKLINMDYVDSASAIVDDSQLYDSEFQLRYKIGQYDLVGGFQYRYYDPKASFLTNADNVNPGKDITATEVGGYLQADTRVLDNKLRLTAAARLDEHTYYDLQFSPKLAAVYSITPNHNIRLGYNRAFKVPVILENHLYLFNGAARGNVNGYTITDAKDSQITGNVVTKFDALKPEEVSTIEIGYKGLWEKKFFIDAVGYYSVYQDFISPAAVVADGRRTFAYDDSGKLTGLGGQLTTYFNYGQAKILGLDIGASYFFSNDVSLDASASFIHLANSDNPYKALGIPLLLNVPTNKYKGTLTVKNQIYDGTLVAFHVRHIPGYTFRAGRWNGKLDDRTVVDLTIGYNWKPYGLSFQASVSNLFDDKTPDVLGAPVTERFFLVQVTKTFGSFIND
ncbi:MAG: TonB-dependent receptor [Chlorobiales bacterium]|nr:TonB-dependent receptor [Chlorobiales bacterium]